MPPSYLLKNTVDAEVMLGDLQRHGMRVTGEPEDADVLIVNTCAFVEDAKRESIAAIMEAAALKEESEASGEISFYDSNTGNQLFTAPKGRSFEQFVKESRVHGWPSFRDDEVNWDYVRVLPDGEAVSVDGTHLGHNLPDKNGNRYCINLVSVAGRPKKA